ncbi:unnamed protein product, partial [Bubo scandiacus]
MGAAEGLAEWRKRGGDEIIGARAARPGGATTVFGKVTGKARPRQRRRRGRGRGRGRGGSRGFALCALPLPFPPSPRARRHPEPRTRCAVPGSAAGRV